MAEATVADGGLDRRRLVLLCVLGLAQLMVVLDLTVMNIALLSAQRVLHFSTVDRQWVVTAYTLSFGSLLLLGGKLSDLLGRKVTFLTGLAGFAGVSAIGGVWPDRAGATAHLAQIRSGQNRGTCASGPNQDGHRSPRPPCIARPRAAE